MGILLFICNEVSTSCDQGSLTSTHLFVSYVMHTNSFNLFPRSLCKFSHKVYMRSSLESVLIRTFI